MARPEILILAEYLSEAKWQNNNNTQIGYMKYSLVIVHPVLYLNIKFLQVVSSGKGERIDKKTEKG